jgi:hypothetical protein
MIPDRGISALCSLPRPSLPAGSARKSAAYLVVGVVSEYVAVSTATISGSAKSGVPRAAGLALEGVGASLLLGEEDWGKGCGEGVRRRCWGWWWMRGVLGRAKRRCLFFVWTSCWDACGFVFESGCSWLGCCTSSADGKVSSANCMLLRVSSPLELLCISSSPFSNPCTAPFRFCSQVLHTPRPKPGSTFAVQSVPAQRFRPGVLALKGDLSSSMGLLRLNSRRRERSVTIGDRRLEGDGAARLVRDSLRGVGRVGRNCGEGASVGGVGYRWVDGFGVEVVDLGTDRGIDAAVRGGVMGRQVDSEKRPGERRNEGAAVLGYGRRKDVHSEQVHDMFMREREVEAILFSLSPSVVTRTVRTMPCIYYSRCRWNYIVHA